MLILATIALRIQCSAYCVCSVFLPKAVFYISGRMAEEEREQEFLTEDDVLEVIELENQQVNGDSHNGDVREAAANVDEESELMDVAPHEAAASVEAPDVSTATFSMHTGEVFSVDVSALYAASGGEDDRAFVWKLEDGSVVFEFAGHSDSVTYVRFNARKTLLATACMAGLVQVWRAGDFSKVAELQVGDLLWLQWHHAADILFCGSEDGSTWMYLVPNGDCKVFPGYGFPCSVGELFPDGKRLCAGYGDGGVRIWDLKTSTFTAIEGASTHKSPVTCASVNQDNTLLATGCEDGMVNLTHASSGKIVTTFACTREVRSDQGRQQQNDGDDEDLDTDANVESNSVETVAFSRISPLLFTGTVNGEMAIWDLNTHIVRQTFPLREGVVKAVWIDHCILVADLGGGLRLYDSRNGELVSQWLGHKGAVLDFSLSPDASTLVSCSADRTCKVFRLDGGRSEIND